MLAREQGVEDLYVSVLSANEAAVVSGVSVYPVRELSQLLRHLRGDSSQESRIEPLKTIELLPILEDSEPLVDFNEIAGQEMAKRAAELAASGGHNLILVGPPGGGQNHASESAPLDPPAATTG